MEPALYSGDLALTWRQNNYSVGDIVAFQVNEGLVIHRIAGGSAEEGFDLQGDNKTGRDPWHPVLEEISGKLWLRVPRAGQLVALSRQPLVLATLTVGIVLVAFPSKKLTQRRMRAGMRSYVNRALSQTGESVLLTVLLSLSGVLIVTTVVLAFLGFSKPLQMAELVERPQYAHNGLFTYTVHMEPSTLAPDGVLGPILPSLDEEIDDSEPTSVFTRLVRRLELQYAYSLDAPRSVSLEGAFLPELRIDAGDAWSKTLQLSPQEGFTGDTFSGVVQLDFGEILALIETIEEETGFDAGTYTLTIVPTVLINGQIGSEEVDDIYAPEFVMSVNRGQILIDGDLARSEDRIETEEVVGENSINVLGGSLSVRLARWTGAVGAVLALITTLVIVSMGVLGFGQPDDARIQARYGSLILSIKRKDLAQGGRTVDMDSIDDLARFAQQTGRNIFHLRLGRISHLYFVEDGGVTYRYVTPGSRMERWKL